MKALTVYRPWSHAIAYLGKPIEIRSYPPPGGLTVLAIHAGQRWYQRAAKFILGPLKLSLPDRVEMPGGRIVAVVAVVGAHTDTGGCCAPWGRWPGYERLDRGDLSRQPRPALWHWELADVRPLPDPVPCTGRQGLWALPEDVEAAVREQLAGEPAVSASPAIWLLDVDGVLNAAKPGWSAPPRTGTAYAGATPWRLRFAPALIERVRALHASKVVEVRWCSTWCAWADQVEHVFGMPRLERAISDAAAAAKGEVTREAKLAAALAVVRSGRRLVWTDDEAIPEDGPEREELEAAGALLIAPRARSGLQRGHLDQIEAFLSSDPAHAAG